MALALTDLAALDAMVLDVMLPGLDGFEGLPLSNQSLSDGQFLGLRGRAAACISSALRPLAGESTHD